MKKDGRSLKTTAIYTALFAVGFAVCYGGLVAAGRMPIWATDGRMQHYPFMVCIGQWLRDAVGSLFGNGELRRFDFALGFGEDVLVSLNYYGLGDPLMLISALFAGESTEAGYFLLMALRCWCAGMACMALARFKGFSRTQTLYSGLVYAFSLGFFTMASLRHGMFANPYIHLPLILLGMEHVLERKDPWLLSMAVALAALCGFYFLYAHSVLLLLYALIRYFFSDGEKSLKGLGITAARSIGWYLLGLGLAACVLLPVLLGMAGSQRMSAAAASSVRLHDSLWNYLRYPLAVLTGESAGAVPFVPVVGVLGMALMALRHRRGDRGWLAVAGALLLMLLTPLTGWALNGFSYESDRWCFAAYLAAALLGGRMLPELFETTRRERRILGIFALLLAAYPVAAYALGVSSDPARAVFGPAAVIATAAALLLRERMTGERGRKLAAAALGVVLLANIGAAHVLAGRELIPAMMPAGGSYAELTGSVYAGLPEREGFGRTDADVDSTQAFNAPAALGVAGTAEYNSLIDDTVCGFMADMNSAGRIHDNVLLGLDGRAALEALWSVDRYVTVSDGRTPYGFEYAGVTETGAALYENRYALPVGYVMTETVARESYEAMHPLERQWALLQGALTEEATALPEAEPVLSVSEAELLGVETENLEWADGVLRVGEGGVLRLKFDAPADCELYAELIGFSLPVGPDDTGNRVEFETETTRTSVLMVAESSGRAVDRESMLVNLGYSEMRRTTAEIRFARPGEYRLEAIELYVQPMAEFASMIEEIRGRGLRDAVVNGSSVSGTIDLDVPGVMVFSIPHSEGWEAFVDGRAAELTSSGAFLALELTAGSHEIRLEYATPGWNLGLSISLIAASLLLTAIIPEWHSSRRARQKGEQS